MHHSSLKAQHALNLVEETARSIGMMEQCDREDLIKLLLTWMIANKLGDTFRPTLHALSRYCIAECLRDNPSWVPPYAVDIAAVRR